MPSLSRSSSSSGSRLFTRDTVTGEPRVVFRENMAVVAIGRFFSRNRVAVELSGVFSRVMVAVELRGVFSRDVVTVELSRVQQEQCLSRAEEQPTETDGQPLPDTFYPHRRPVAAGRGAELRG